jgi:hypothetical protein
VLLIREGADGGAPDDLGNRLAACGLRLEQRLRYASEVVRFDWQALLVCRRAETRKAEDA